MTTPLIISVTNGNITVTGSDGNSSLFDKDNNLLTVFNIPFTLSTYKRDNDRNEMLSGAHFALYKQIKSSGGTLRKDYYPLPGYEDLISGDDGLISEINNSLPAATYYLTETEAPDGFLLLESDIIFTISELGRITIDSTGHHNYLRKEETANGINYILTVPNSSNEQNCILAITKQVSGDMGEITRDFMFVLNSVEDENSEDVEYTWTKIIPGDSQGESGTLRTSSGNNTFRLKHGETIEISLPHDKAIQITEDHGNYISTWDMSDNNLSEVTPVTNGYSFKLAGNAEIIVDNNLPAVAPTGFNTRHTPWLLLLLFGLMLLIGGGVVVKRRRGDDPDEGEVAVHPAPLNTGPLGRDNRPVARERESVNTGQPTHSTQNVEEHIRWRNSVWVENNGPQRGFAPPRATDSCPQEKRTNSCPQAKLWMTRTGPTGKRGDAG